MEANLTFTAYSAKLRTRSVLCSRTYPRANSLDDMTALNDPTQLIAREQSRVEMAKPQVSAKFMDPKLTAGGEPRAHVALRELETLWFNTGTLCNLTCSNCYIESSPSNDRLAYMTLEEVLSYLEEIEAQSLGVREIGFTGGEPFMNPEFMEILHEVLSRGYATIVLTNAMRPMMKCAERMLELQREFGAQLTMRVSVDHYERACHEQERGKRSYAPMILGLKWLSQNGFAVHVAGRTRWGGDEGELRLGFAQFFAANDIQIDAQNAAQLVLFPELDPNAEVPEITQSCWGILNVDPADMMCASSRMVVKRKGRVTPSVLACTLLPYESEFELADTLAESLGPIALNHAHCAKFCVLGGASCSA